MLVYHGPDHTVGLEYRSVVADSERVHRSRIACESEFVARRVEVDPAGLRGGEGLSHESRRDVARLEGGQRGPSQTHIHSAQIAAARLREAERVRQQQFYFWLLQRELRQRRCVFKRRTSVFLNLNRKSCEIV